MTDIQFNSWFFLIVIAFVVIWKIDFFTTLLNLKSFKSQIPSDFVDVMDQEKFEESKDYTRLKSVYGIGISAFMTVVFFSFWWLGGFGWLDGVVRGFGYGPLLSGVIYIGILFLALQIISLPFSWYSTFGIESKFGFNKMSPGLFFGDFIRSLFLSALVGGPLLLTILWLFEKFPAAWLWGWVIVSVFMLAAVFLAPTLVMPLFNKFTPLEEGPLKSEIFAMAEKCEFPVKEISIMDGSKRSTKSNAFFTGFGATKRIVLFDTLVEKHSVAELVGVLAHEIGHYKKGHIVKGIVIAIVSTGVMFFLLNVVMANRSLFDAFGVRETSVYVSLILFGILMQPVNQILGIAGSWLSRKHEFEADAYAAEVTGQPEVMASALRKLSADNLTNLTPHPAYVFLNYSHPPVVERIAALRD
ncbi:MAG: M48 family metallopeptidase [Verrucomicrobiales bacterium]|nr:M48 family metallopeptidase [Verrucomicrobiales bacterium]